MAPSAPRLHSSYDLTIRFGTQSRTKCVGCGRYFTVTAVGAERVGRCNCGTHYVEQPNGRFKVVQLP